MPRLNQLPTLVPCRAGTVPDVAHLPGRHGRNCRDEAISVPRPAEDASGPWTTRKTCMQKALLDRLMSMAQIVVFGVVAADVILRVPRIPASGDHVNAEALGWRIGGSSANVACGLSSAGHHVRLVGPVGSDPMGGHLLAELERYGVDTGYCFRADAGSPRTLILLDDTGERTIIAVGSGAGPSSFLPVRGPDLRSAACVYIEGYTRYPADTAAAAESALVVTSPPVPGATTWPATVVVGSETQYADVAPFGMFEAVRSVSGERLEWVVVTRGREGADAYAATSDVHVDAAAADQVDATGAGDAFTVGLLNGLLQGDDMVTALRIGAACGAATVGQLRSIPVPWEELAGPFHGRATLDR